MSCRQARGVHALLLGVQNCVNVHTVRSTGSVVEQVLPVPAVLVLVESRFSFTTVSVSVVGIFPSFSSQPISI